MFPPKQELIQSRSIVMDIKLSLCLIAPRRAPDRSGNPPAAIAARRSIA
jgi:hypothetical protein